MVVSTSWAADDRPVSTPSALWWLINGQVQSARHTAILHPCHKCHTEMPLGLSVSSHLHPAVHFDKSMHLLGLLLLQLLCVSPVSPVCKEEQTWCCIYTTLCIFTRLECFMWNYLLTLDYCLEDCSVRMPKSALLTNKNWSQIVLWLNLNQNWKNSIVDRQLPDPHSNVRDRRCLIIDQFWENFKPSPDNKKWVHQHLIGTLQILELISAFFIKCWDRKPTPNKNSEEPVITISFICI